MAHHSRSKSTSSIDSVLEAHSSAIMTPSSTGSTTTTGSSATTAPLSISIPRSRSMSQSFHLATSPITFAHNNTNPFMTSPTSANSINGSGTTPPTNLSSLASSIPISISGRRFSSSFTNPLTTSATVGSPPTTGFAKEIEQSRRASTSLFGSTSSTGTSPPFSRHPVPPLPNEIPHNNTDTGGHGGGGGIGALFRKFSASNRGTVGFHPAIPDKNEAGPGHPLDFATENNNYRGGPHQHPPLHNAHLDVKKTANADGDSRSNSPMRNMILNGQMLD
ncbi:hypothetical protein BGZ83_003526 [Gryganskiella cystojenkinii]|nr:hypothetical protein BGZ83_003526 [Gryganskiella cystojenkinii]